MELTTLLSLCVSIRSTNCIADHEEFCETVTMRMWLICSLLEMHLSMTSPDYSTSSLPSHSCSWTTSDYFVLDSDGQLLTVQD